MTIKKIVTYIFTFFFISGCVIYKSYIPIKTEKYNINENKIIYDNNSVRLEIAGKYGRPDKYGQVSIFNLKMNSYHDTLQFFPNEIKLFSSDLKPFKIIQFNHNKDDREELIILPGNIYSADIEYVIVDSLLIEPEDNIEGVKLIVDGLYRSGKKIIDTDFLFSTKIDSSNF